MLHRRCASVLHNAGLLPHWRRLLQNRDFQDTVYKRLRVIQDKYPGRREQLPLSIRTDQQHCRRGLMNS
jgi:hypothetical protein